MKISASKVKKYIEMTFITFSDEEGKLVFDIMTKYCGEISIPTLRKKIRCKNLKFQDLLYRVLSQNESENYKLTKYFSKFRESEDILNFDLRLTLEDILAIKHSSKDCVEQMSIKLNKIESIIYSYICRYSVHPVEFKYQLQEKKIFDLYSAYGANSFSFDNYRTIITVSFEEIVRRVRAIPKSERMNSRNVFIELLALVFYYLKCSLPFEDIARIIANVSEITLTTHDVFHLIYQLSDSVLRAFCIEHYLFSNAVPLYYPKLKQPQIKSSGVEFEICKELWYCLEQYNGLISFGLGRASWNPVGKSSLLDLIFETDFAKGSPQSSAFHYGSIDIQLTKNLFGEATESHLESTKRAYIDCNGYSDLNVIRTLCSHLDVALIHVCYNDYENNMAELEEELALIEKEVSHIYLLLRDCKCDTIQTSMNDKSQTIVLIPNLTRSNIKHHSVVQSLKEIGHQILHLKIEDSKLIQSQLIEDILLNMNSNDVKVFQKYKQLIKNITEYYGKSNQTDFSCLNYYPTFADYMSLFYKASYETKQDEIDKISTERQRLSEKLSNISRGNIVTHFSEILQQENSTLLLWKLSRELFYHSKISASKEESATKNTLKDQKKVNLTLEILWRESILSQRYGQNTENKDKDGYKQLLAENFSKYVGSGEAFELIDGDNLRFFNRDIDSLLCQFYKKQEEMLKQLNKGNSVKIKPAPIVVSIFGPQSSGKSTLLNYCFGCKFLTSAGRCTRGIYASLSRLDRPVNLSQSFLILDTEGLNSIERENIKDTSTIHFDRTMVLFCLAVSQVVIINVKGDLGSEMQNLLQICAHSLNRLKVNKVKAPKIFFVLNQQADPDPKRYLNAINLLLEKLNAESGPMEIGVKMSELIQISRDNLFILPSAFNSLQINKPDAILFDSNVLKLSPTIAFADKCTKLRLAIIDQLDHMSVNDRAPFQNISEWMEMAGVIWDTIIKYQDIVRYRNLEELMCSNKLGEIASTLMKEHIYSHEREFIEIVQTICKEISGIGTYTDHIIILNRVMIKFDEVFTRYKKECLSEFSALIRDDSFLKKMQHICKETESNIKMLINVVKKQHEDQIKLQLNSVLTEIHISESMEHFQRAIIKNVDNYLVLNEGQQKKAFEDIWNKTFGSEDQEAELRELQDNFSNLYSLFSIEYAEMEIMQTIYSKFNNLEFNMNRIIKELRSNLLYEFHNLSKINQLERLVYPLSGYQFPLKEMFPYNGRPKYDYLCKDYICEIGKKRSTNTFFDFSRFFNKTWIPNKCDDLVRYCCGYENHPDIIFKPNHKVQVTTLTSVLKNPDDSTFSTSTWEKFINDISSDVTALLETNSDVSHAVVKQIINKLHFRIKLMNHEIQYILASLSIFAERTLSTLVFAYAFKYHWEKKYHIRQTNQAKKDNKKRDLLKYFVQKIENRKMARGEWNQETMTRSDREFSQNYALRYIESVKRGLITSEQQNIKKYLEDKREVFSHENIASLADEIVAMEISKDPGIEVTDANNFVVQFICNRNTMFKKIFRDKWREEENKLYELISRNVRISFKVKISNLKDVFSKLLDQMCLSKTGGGAEDLKKRFVSDNNFELFDLSKVDPSQVKEIPFKAMNNYLKMYLDPAVTPEEFENYLSSVFKIDGLDVKVCEVNSLCSKPTDPKLNVATFSRLVNTKMFNDTELVFDMHHYVKQFQSFLEDYRIDLTQNEFQEMIENLKGEYETNMIGCPSQCPSCGKFCEREIHTFEGKCEIKTGHQISSMGGKVWNADKDKTAVLYMCDAYKKDTQIILPHRTMKWEDFQDECKEWNWILPDDEKYRSKQLSNQKLMKDIWNKFGRGILRYYYEKDETNILFIPYTTLAEVNQPLFSSKYYICFVIDGTGSMRRDISRVQISIGQLIKHFTEGGSLSEFKVVIYRDHCDDKLLEIFPNKNEFTPQHKTVEDFLNNIVADGGGDFPEAVLDGLATAATQSEWRCTPGVRNKIIHIFDAPPHGDFPNYTSHSSYSNIGNCCCCNHGTKCNYDWDRDVWKIFKKFNIEYHGINTVSAEDLAKFSHKIDKHLIFSNYELKMKEKLENLCSNFQVVGKELVNDAIVQIFVDRKM